MISFPYYVGFWHRGEKPTALEFTIKSFYCIYNFFLSVSLAIGSITNGNVDQSIFLAEESTIAAVLGVKLWFLIWNQKEILELLNEIGIVSIRNDDDDLAFVNDKMRKFIKLLIVLVIFAFVGGFCETLVVPLIRLED